MGLAASQARFLGLTARKSNIEYQGQQINQARTSLSNEVMNLYEKYNKLDVPVPPSVNDYTKTVYKIDETEENYEISSFSKIPSGDYKDYYDVVLKCVEEIPKAYPLTVKGLIATCEKAEGTYNKLSFTIGTDTYEYDGSSEASKKASTITRIPNADIEKYSALRTIIEEGKLSGDEIAYYMYTRNGVQYFTSESDLNDTFDGGQDYHGDFTFEYQGYFSKDRYINATAALTQNSSGRLSSITVVQCDDDPDLVNTSHSISTSSEDDEKAYDDAMNQYYYDKAVYEREVDKINKKTEKIQTQDKALELKLNQLDTEQNAIKTEMDSISKVIEDTIEKVFKTYNS